MAPLPLPAFNQDDYGKDFQHLAAVYRENVVVPASNGNHANGNSESNKDGNVSKAVKNPSNAGIKTGDGKTVVSEKHSGGVKGNDKRKGGSNTTSNNSKGSGSGASSTTK